jgi:hypothetical protein
MRAGKEPLVLVEKSGRRQSETPTDSSRECMVPMKTQGNLIEMIIDGSMFERLHQEEVHVRP